MPIWPVSSEITIRLSNWGVFSIPNPDEGRDQHFYGYDETAATGRVSTKIIKFYPREGYGITDPGRRYELVGASGQDPDAIYVMDQWIKINKVVPGTVRDVTKKYIGALKRKKRRINS